MTFGRREKSFLQILAICVFREKKILEYFIRSCLNMFYGVEGFFLFKNIPIGELAGWWKMMVVIEY